MTYVDHINPSNTPQTERLDARQVENSAGGFSYAVTPWQRLRRFLILGAEGGSYYASERELVIENVAAWKECLELDAERALRELVEVSESGAAPKQSPALFCLAVALAYRVGEPNGDAYPAVRVRAEAAKLVPRIARTGTHLFELVASVQKLRGWGQGLRKAIATWYTEKDNHGLAYQLVKYQSRSGFTHHDVLALAHPVPATASQRSLFRWVAWQREDTEAHAGPDTASGFDKTVKQRGAEDLLVRYADLPAIVRAYETVKRLRPSDALTKKRVLALVTGTSVEVPGVKLTHEMVPNEWKNDPDVWAAFLEYMPLEAMVRNLGKMTSVGLLRPLSDASKTVVSRLQDAERIHRARLHPMKVLSALRVYQQGHGVRGGLSWDADKSICAALDKAFYLAFKAVEPSNKNMVLALDVSGSMGSPVMDSTGLTPREATAAMALVTMHTEPHCYVMAFSDKLVPIDIRPNDRLEDVVRKTASLPFGGTDCSLPITWAIKQKASAIDMFVVYTDSETWAGLVHPAQALRDYRKMFKRQARLAVVGMVANGFTIADPADPLMLDVVGFDTSTPAALSEFAKL